jgi:hypothetical protein
MPALVIRFGFFRHVNGKESTFCLLPGVTIFPDDRFSGAVDERNQTQIDDGGLN